MTQKATKKTQKTQFKTLRSLQRFLVKHGDKVTTRRWGLAGLRARWTRLCWRSGLRGM